MVDGRQPTGIEYEYYQAFKQDGHPVVLIYHLQKAPTIDINASPEDQQETFRQFQLAQTFVNGITQDESGHYVGDKFSFETSEQFRDQLEQDLKRLVSERMVPVDRGAIAVQSKPDLATVPKAYLHWLRDQLPELSLKGMKPKIAYPARLPDIYVPALVMARHDEKRDQEHWESRQQDNLKLLLTRLDNESLYASGAPGSGKTTFCLWLCWLISEGGLLSHPIEAPDDYQEALPTDLMGRLPILCRLRGFWGQCLELAYTQVSSLEELGEQYFTACQQALEVVEDPEQRSRLFDVLARLGLDRRPGVGLRVDGLPDIDWVEIPAGEFIYGEDAEQLTLHLETYHISRYPITSPVSGLHRGRWL